MVAVTKYHKLDDISQNKFILSQFQSLKFEMEVSGGLVPSGSSEGEPATRFSSSRF